MINCWVTVSSLRWQRTYDSSRSGSPNISNIFFLIVYKEHNHRLHTFAAWTAYLCTNMPQEFWYHDPQLLQCIPLPTNSWSGDCHNYHLHMQQTGRPTLCIKLRFTQPYLQQTLVTPVLPFLVTTWWVQKLVKNISVFREINHRRKTWYGDWGVKLGIVQSKLCESTTKTKLLS